MGLAGGTGAATLIGTGAFSSVDSDREAAADAAPDAEAMLAIETLDTAGSDGDSLSVLRLTNQFSESLTNIAVEVVSAGGFGFTTSDIGHPNALGVGSTGTVTVPLSCGSTRTDDVTLRITGSGSDTTISTTETLGLSCQAAGALCDISTPFIRGGGQGKPPDQGEQPPDDMDTETGAVSITRGQDNQLTVSIEMDEEDGKQLGEVHIDAQTDPADFPRGLGRYHLTESFDTGKYSYSTTIDLSAELGFSSDQDIGIAVHGALANHPDSAWAKGPFQGINWRMYVSCHGG